MKIKNTSKKLFNLASGVCKPGDTAEVTTTEFKLLVSQKRCEVAEEAPKPVVKKKSVKTDG